MNYSLGENGQWLILLLPNGVINQVMLRLCLQCNRKLLHREKKSISNWAFVHTKKRWEKNGAKLPCAGLESGWKGIFIWLDKFLCHYYHGSSNHRGGEWVGTRIGTQWDGSKYSRVRTGIQLIKPSRSTASVRCSMYVEDSFQFWAVSVHTRPESFYVELKSCLQ